MLSISAVMCDVARWISYAASLEKHSVITASFG